MTDIVADFRYAARALLARRAFSIAAVLTLALGIGMTTAIFGIVNGVALRSLPLPNADRLITICEDFPGATSAWCGIAPPNVEDIASRAQAIEALGIGRSWSVTLATPDGVDNLDAGIATPGMFRALGFRPVLGRLFDNSDLTGRPGNVAVLTYEMWQSRFGGDREILGRTIVLDNAPVTVVGVIEAGIRVPLFESVELWRPVHIDPRSEDHRNWRGFVAYGRLRTGVTLTEAAAELSGIERDLRASHFATTEHWGLRARTLQDLVVGSVRGPLYLFLGAVFLVLLIACVNVANLVLARGASRAREFAVRAALGSSRARLVRSILAESLLLSVTGGAIGILIAVWATELFRWAAPAGIPRVAQVGVDTTVLAFAAGVTVLTTILFGLVPALRLSRVNLSQSLREGGRAVSARGRLGRALVVAELAISLPLVTGAALLARSFATLSTWEPGFEREHLATFSVFLPSTAYARRSDIADVWAQLEQELASVPGVTGVSTASAGPLFGGRETWEMEIEGRLPDERATIRWYDVGPGFFAALGIPVVRGRDFGTQDRFGAPSAALVNETLASRYWPNDNPLGKRVTFHAGGESEAFTVVGIVRDSPPLDPASRAEPEMYWSNRQAPRPFTYFIVRTAVPPRTTFDALAARVRSVNRDFTARNFATYDDLLSRNLRSPRFNMLLLVVFGAVALALAGIGTYGMLSYFVVQRSRDIGIHLALGATRGRVVASVARRGLTLAAAGVAIGVVASVALSRTVASLVAGVSPRDPVTLAASAVAVMIVATLACVVPAWRASRVDPATTLVAE